MLKKHTAFEKVGQQPFQMQVAMLHVHDEIALSPNNPRLAANITEDFKDEEALESDLRAMPGYDGLKRSIAEVGQMEPIYVKATTTGKHLVLEGNTRVTVFRELDRKHKSGKQDGKFRDIEAKIVPQNFDDRDEAILLAQIHVRGSGVRSWTRFLEAKFIHETVEGGSGKPSLMTQTELAREMGKSLAWVNRIKSAYEFGMKFVDYCDDGEETLKQAIKNFTVLEEISKAKNLGSQLRDYENTEYDQLRAEVFEAVKNDAFKEVRDARFLPEFHADPEMWQQLQSGEKHIAHQLAGQIKSKQAGLKAQIASLPKRIERMIQHDDDTDFSEDDISQLQLCIDLIEEQVHEGVPPYRIIMKKVTKHLNKANREDIKDLEQNDLNEVDDAYKYFRSIADEHQKSGNSDYGG